MQPGQMGNDVTRVISAMNRTDFAAKNNVIYSFLDTDNLGPGSRLGAHPNWTS